MYEYLKNERTISLRPKLLQTVVIEVFKTYINLSFVLLLKLSTGRLWHKQKQVEELRDDPRHQNTKEDPLIEDLKKESQEKLYKNDPKRDRGVHRGPCH